VTTARSGKFKLHYLHTEPLELIARRWQRSGRKGDRS
jgi:hypothetical protein